jgi:hypothetical protein
MLDKFSVFNVCWIMLDEIVCWISTREDTSLNFCFIYVITFNVYVCWIKMQPFWCGE